MNENKNANVYREIKNRQEINLVYGYYTNRTKSLMKKLRRKPSNHWRENGKFILDLVPDQFQILVDWSLAEGLSFHKI